MMMRVLESLHNRFAGEMITGTAAVLLVDTLNSFTEPLAEAAKSVAANAAGLARVAGAFGVPVMLSTREGQGPACAQVASVVPQFHVFERSGTAVLADQPTLGALRRLRRRVLFLAAWGRGQDIMEAALEARRAGFELRIVVDACWIGDDPGGLDVSARMVAAGFELTTWVAVVAALSQDYPTGSLPGHIHRAIAESLTDYAPAIPALWQGEARFDRVELL